MNPTRRVSAVVSAAQYVSIAAVYCAVESFVVHITMPSFAAVVADGSHVPAVVTVIAFVV